MSEAKYRKIAADMERRILEGNFGDRIPPTRILALEYNVSRQTILAALKVFKESGLLLSRGRRRGIKVVPKASPRKGVIGIVYTGGFDLRPEETVYGDMLRRIHEDGYDFLFIGMSQRSYSWREVLKLFTDHFVGLLFSNGALNEELIAALQRKFVAFLSCNRLPLVPGIHYFDFDHEYLFRKVLEQLQAVGCRRPALFFPSNIDGFSDMIHRLWRRLKRAYGLEWQEFDTFVPDAGMTYVQNFERLVRVLGRCRTLPDYLIYWGEITPRVHQLLTASNLPPSVPVICNDVSKDYCDNPRYIQLMDFDYRKFYLCAYDVLRELILAPGSQPIRRAFTPEVKFINSLVPDHGKAIVFEK